MRAPVFGMAFERRVVVPLVVFAVPSARVHAYHNTCNYKSHM